MRNTLRHLGIVAVLLVLASCSQDEGTLTRDSPIIGTWDLDMIVYNDFPEGFGNNDGTIISAEDLKIDRLSYRFYPDGTFTSVSDIQDKSWAVNGEFNYIRESLELDVFDISEQEELVVARWGSLVDDSRIEMNMSVDVLALPNEVLDTLTAEISEKDFELYALPVTAKLYYFFDKSDIGSL